MYISMAFFMPFCIRIKLLGFVSCYMNDVMALQDPQAKCAIVHFSYLVLSFSYLTFACFLINQSIYFISYKTITTFNQTA